MSLSPVRLDLNGFLRVLECGLEVATLLVGVGPVTEAEVIIRS